MYSSHLLSAFLGYDKSVPVPEKIHVSSVVTLWTMVDWLRHSTKDMFFLVCFPLLLLYYDVLLLVWLFSSTEYGTKLLIDESFLCKKTITILSTGVQEQQLKTVEV